MNLRRTVLCLFSICVAGVATMQVPATASATSPPVLGRPNYPTGCAGSPYVLPGYGFDVGSTYRVTSSGGVLSSDTVVANKYGVLQIDIDLPPETTAGHYVDVAVYADGTSTDPLATGSIDLRISDFTAPVTPYSGFPVGSTVSFTGNCFAPGERVRLTSPQVTLTSSVPIVADADGGVATQQTVTAIRATGDAVVTATGLSSGRRAETGFGTGQSTLDAGSSVGAFSFSGLVAPRGHYLLTVRSFDVEVGRYPSARPLTYEYDLVWASPGLTSPDYDTASLRLGTDGNLVYVTDGRPRWGTGTAAAGARLSLRDDGDLVLTSGSGQLLWSTHTGLVRGAGGFVTYAYSASSRSGRVVYVNGLIHRRVSNADVVNAAGRKAYLQRYLDAGWQTMAARTTDAHGRLAVGFTATRAMQYRWVVPAAGADGSARSLSTVH